MNEITNSDKDKKVDLIIDLQYGSTGKGKVAGFMAKRSKYDVVVNANMPNAGHTFIDNDGTKYVHKVLPNGIVSPNLNYCLLGAGSVFDLKQLKKEVDFANKHIPGGFPLSKLKIHFNAVVLKPEHKNAEKEFSRIGSTKQGSAGAMIDRIMRDPQNKVIARDVLSKSDFAQCLVNNHDYLEIINGAKRILAEGAQGYSLGISQGFYPYCTSRDCTPGRLLSDMNIPIQLLNNTIGVMRPYPIRVAGDSGDIYPDQVETSWDEIGVEPELTTVTGKIRRVFTLSRMQLRDAIEETRPDEIVINFVDYLTIHQLNEVKTLLLDIPHSEGIRYHYGTGALDDQMIVSKDNHI